MLMGGGQSVHMKRPKFMCKPKLTCYRHPLICPYFIQTCVCVFLSVRPYVCRFMLKFLVSVLYCANNVIFTLLITTISKKHFNKIKKVVAFNFCYYSFWQPTSSFLYLLALSQKSLLAKKPKYTFTYMNTYICKIFLYNIFILK